MNVYIEKIPSSCLSHSTYKLGKEYFPGEKNLSLKEGEGKVLKLSGCIGGGEPGNYQKENGQVLTRRPTFRHANPL